jgi:cysteine desulfurase
MLLTQAIPNLVVNGDIGNRLAGSLHVSIPGVPNGAVIGRIRHRIAVSTGAACSSGIEAPSHVLRAMDLPESLLAGALRIGLGKFTTDDEVTLAAEAIGNAAGEIREALNTSG